jgi:NarL family two-component system response regulator YdfI
MMGKLREGKKKSKSGVLTDRELEVIQLIADGLTTKDMAARLNIGDRTVEFYVSNIYDKLGVNTRASIVRWAQEHGLL